MFALNLTTGLGLGLAIDYSLFMVSRYREESTRSGFGLEALRRTLQTAGRTIVFSSLTIAAAIASLVIFPQRFLYSMGVAGALVGHQEQDDQRGGDDDHQDRRQVHGEAALEVQVGGGLARHAEVEGCFDGADPADQVLGGG